MTSLIAYNYRGSFFFFFLTSITHTHLFGMTRNYRFGI